MPKLRIIIVCPFLASANNGNWQTALRWSQLLASSFDVEIIQEWHGEPADVMLALHARRSATSIARWAQARGESKAVTGLGVVLTGTDLYRDIHNDASAQDSLRYARHLIVLQERAPDALPLDLHSKTRVIFQSCPQRQATVKSSRPLRVVMIGHLRDEKSPETLFDAVRRLAPTSDIVIDHIGAALDAELGRQAELCAANFPHYHWHGGLPHEEVLCRLQEAHVLIQSSRIEGGALTVLEAVNSGTVVLASRIAGNVGLLGPEYGGYFDWGDAAALLDLLLRCRDTNSASGLYHQLKLQCAQRAPLFSPALEQANLIQLVGELAPQNP